MSFTASSSTPRFGWLLGACLCSGGSSPLSFEAGWELFENTAYVIDRYRATAAAAGSSGDSILNSMCDILFMVAGFLLARRLPLWASVGLVILFELIPLYAIRDDLTLNIWMFLWPNASVEAWQARG